MDKNKQIGIPKVTVIRRFLRKLYCSPHEKGYLGANGSNYKIRKSCIVGFSLENAPI